jgi:hypothetical protein
LPLTFLYYVAGDKYRIAIIGLSGLSFAHIGVSNDVKERSDCPHRRAIRLAAFSRLVVPSGAALSAPSDVRVMARIEKRTQAKNCKNYEKIIFQYLKALILLGFVQ